MCFQLQRFWQVSKKITYCSTYWLCLRVCLLVCDTEMWKKKVNGARESLICMTSVGSLWTRHVDSLSWPTLADVLQRRMKLKERGWCHSENTQCTNMFRCIPFYLFIDLLVEFSKSWLTSSSIFLLDHVLYCHCWGKEWGQIWIIFPRGGMKYKTHTRQHFISVYMTLILQSQISVWVLAHLNSPPCALLERYLLSFGGFFFQASSETLNVVIVELWLKRIPSK